MSVAITGMAYAGAWRESWPLIGTSYVVPDLSWNGRHATTTTDPVWGTFSSGIHAERKAVTRAKEGGVIVGGVPELLNGGAFACWARVRSTSSGFAERRSEPNGWGFLVRNGTQLRTYIDGFIHQYIAPASLADDSPRHYATAWGAGQASMWIDGVLVYRESGANPTTGGSTRLFTGESSAGSGAFRFDGDMTDAVFRDSPWTDAEAAWLADPANDLRSPGGEEVATPRILSPYLIGGVG